MLSSATSFFALQQSHGIVILGVVWSAAGNSRGAAAQINQQQAPALPKLSFAPRRSEANGWLGRASERCVEITGACYQILACSSGALIRQRASRKLQQTVPDSNESACWRSRGFLASVFKAASKSYERNLVFSGGAPSTVRDGSVEATTPPRRRRRSPPPCYTRPSQRPTHQQSACLSSRACHDINPSLCRDR